MSLEKFCSSLSRIQKQELSIMLIKIALPVWDKYVKKNKLTYRDSIVWLKHSVDKNLLQNVIEEAENILKNPDSKLKIDNIERLKNLHKEFSDPITAIQDKDWKLPVAAEKIFYSAYIFLNAILFNDENQLGESYYYVSINQSIDVIDSEKLLTEEEIKSILENAKYK